ncbi:hypothetical protein SUGI_0734900 [Cryptomeria japonica]|nr:hypothetical protein SUGI_0734900 [Cryptomeria japonica]
MNHSYVDPPKPLSFTLKGIGFLAKIVEDDVVFSPFKVPKILVTALESDVASKVVVSSLGSDKLDIALSLFMDFCNGYVAGVDSCITGLIGVGNLENNSCTPALRAEKRFTDCIKQQWSNKLIQISYSKSI